MRKIAFLTGTRADYGLIRDLIKLFQTDSDFKTYVMVTGAHLSSLHGRTIEMIKADQLQNLVEIDMELDGDKPLDVTNAMAKELRLISEFYAAERPELIIVLGDRYELWPACMAATIYNIPVAHIHGGESTVGAIDEVIRHSVSKMSQMHFCSHESYKKRLENMGENPEFVFNVGAIGLDRIKKMKLLSKDELESQLKLNLKKRKNILCTFHPVTTSEEQSNFEISELIKSVTALIEKDDVQMIVTLPNADTYSSFIREEWLRLKEKYPENVSTFVNLGDVLYLSLMSQMDLVMGNSSSGIFEAPFLHRAVLNIGKRQEGRITSEHIINCVATEADITAGIEKALSSGFQKRLPEFKSIYGNGDSGERIYTTIKKQDFKTFRYKRFFDR